MLPRPCLALALLLTPLPAQLAGVYTVNPTLPASAINFPSLQAAVSALDTSGVAGPVVVLVFDDAGPYVESHPFTTSNGTFGNSTAGLAFGGWAGVSSVNRVTFQPGPGESPVIDASGNAVGVFWNGADYVTLQGFEIHSAPLDAITLYSESTHGQVLDAVISGCRLHDCGGSGVSIYGNSARPQNTLVENCFLWNLETTNAGPFPTTGRFGYVTTRRADNTRIVNNTFVVSTGAGSLLCAIGSNTSGATEVTYAEVSNNVVLKTAGAGRPIVRYQHTSSAVAPLPPLQDSNCFWDTTASPLALYGPGSANTAQTLLDWQMQTGLDLMTLPLDPLLNDPGTGDLHLDVSSPCRGAATVASGVTVDIDGQARPASLDIGADQFSAATIAAAGSGCPGTGGLVPVLRAQQWPFLGNAEFAVLTENALPGAGMLSFISFGVGPAFPLGGGCSAFLDLGSARILPGLSTLGPAGSVGRLVPLPNNALLVGTNIAFQNLVVDTGVPLGVVVTNALDVVLDF